MKTVNAEKKRKVVERLNFTLLNKNRFAKNTFSIFAANGYFRFETRGDF